jgi:Tol biopolymer transport system component
MPVQPISTASIREELDKILASVPFASADRSRALLRFVVEHALINQTDRLKEYTIGTEVFGRGDSFDPRTDPIVRAEASRLRGRLENFYAATGKDDEVEITLPKGSYTPQFIARAQNAAPPDLVPPIVESIPEPTVKPQSTTVASQFSIRSWLFAAAAVATAAAFAVWGVLLLRPPSAPRQVIQFEIPALPNTIFAPPISRQSFAISPDGTRLAFTLTGADGTSVWVRNLADLDQHRIAGSEGSWSLFWSPDSRSIYFTQKSLLKRTNLDTSTTQTVATLPYHAIYGTWRSNGDRLLYLGFPGPHELIPEDGPPQFTNDMEVRWAQFLPNSDRFLHVVFDTSRGKYQCVVTDFKSHQSTVLMDVDSRVQYAPSSHRGEPASLLFLRGGSLVAQGFDVDRLQLVGAALPIVDNIISFRPSAAANFSVSNTGILVVQTSFPTSELRWYNRAGDIVATAARPAPFVGSVRISANDGSVATGVWDANKGAADIWIFQHEGKDVRRLTFAPGGHYRPVWSPIDQRIAFGASQTAGPFLHFIDTVEASGNGDELPLKGTQTIPFPGDFQIPTDWSRDGRFIAYDTSLAEDERQLWVADSTTGVATSLSPKDVAQWGAAFSPDSHMLAFVSDQSGRPEVYVQAFESAPSPHLVGETHQVSRGGAWLVRWRPDGRELFYAGLDSKLYAVPLGPGVVSGEPKPLFLLPGNPKFDSPTDFQFDVLADGQRFVMTTAASATPPPYTVIQNWQDKFHH